jgi:predicted nucleic acid-binding protein
MRYVLDSSVALKWFLAEPDSARALRLRDDARAGVHELLAPDVFPVEITHAITRAERARRITSAEGSAFAALAERERCEVVTADDRLVRNLSARFPFLVLLGSLP